MSEINLTRKIFLEREELNRFQEFLQDDVAFNAVVGNTRQYGIIQTEFVGNDTNFRVGNGTNAGTIQIAKERSHALDIDGNLIRLLARDNIPVTEDSNWYWVRISHQFRKFEEGTVSVNANGQMVGVGTSFLKVLRGQATKVPVKIKFEELDGTSPTNNGTYTVVSVADDTNAVLTSTPALQVESNLRYVVIGSTPIGEIVSTEQLAGLYNYDSCRIELVAETADDTPPALPANGANRYFYVARVMNDSGTVTVQDRRDIDETYWKFNIPGITGAILNRPIAAPSAVNQYVLLGTIPNSVSQFAHFLFTGAAAIQGYIAFIRLNHVNPPGLNVISGNVTIINDAQDTAKNPVFYTRTNTTDNVIELWVRSPAEPIEPSAEFMPGVISLLSENIGAGGDNWSYADSFTWSATEPSNLDEIRQVGGVYSRGGTNLDYDLTIDTLSTRINNLRADTGWIALTPNTTYVNTAASNSFGRQIGNVVTLFFLIRRVDPTPGPGAVTVYNLPDEIDPPLNTPAGTSLPFVVVRGGTPYSPHSMRLSTGGAIFVTEIDHLVADELYEGTITYLV